MMSVVLDDVCTDQLVSIYTTRSPLIFLPLKILGSTFPFSWTTYFLAVIYWAMQSLIINDFLDYIGFSSWHEINFRRAFWGVNSLTHFSELSGSSFLCIVSNRASYTTWNWGETDPVIELSINLINDEFIRFNWKLSLCNLLVSHLGIFTTNLCGLGSST